MECPNCNGEVQYSELDGYDEYGRQEWSPTQCQYCEGTGIINEPS